MSVLVDPAATYYATQDVMQSYICLESHRLIVPKTDKKVLKIKTTLYTRCLIELAAQPGNIGQF